MFELTLLKKVGGPLTKRLSLDADDKLLSDASDCWMASGQASRLQLETLKAFARCIKLLDSKEAIALGRLKEGLPDEVRIKTVRHLAARPSSRAYARTRDTISFVDGAPALMLLDVDLKHLPESVAERVEAAGGLWEAICKAAPDLNGATRLVRASTSAGLFDGAEMNWIRGSAGQHIYLIVEDGADIERALEVLHNRLILAGFGWFEIGKTGQLLERSLVDRFVWAPERLVFEGPPILADPLAQDKKVREPKVHPGVQVDTMQALPDLSRTELGRLDARKRELRSLGQDEAARVRNEADRREAKRVARVTGMEFETALRAVAKRHSGVLTPDALLHFDDPNIGRATVNNVLEAPDDFIGETLADPLEGVDYGRCKAMVMRGDDNVPFIHSFAHGGGVYSLCHDFSTLRRFLKAARADGLVDVFLAKLAHATLEGEELTKLISLVSERTGGRLSDIRRRVKGVMSKRSSAPGMQRGSAPDNRTALPHPPNDGELTPTLELIDELLAEVAGPNPPMRDVSGALVEVRDEAYFGLTDLLAVDKVSEGRLAALPEPTIRTLDNPSTCRLIERHIEFHREASDGGAGRPVRLDDAFVNAFRTYSSSRLPTLRSIVVAPMIGPNRQMVSGIGLDRELGVYFQIDPDLLQLVPDPHSVTEEDAAEAYRFLAKEWLVDVATGDEGKAIAIALALTLIQRALLPERPAFWFTSGQRGGGKSTLTTMIVQAVLGRRPSIGVWAAQEEERRKRIMAKLREGCASIVWDNVPAGSSISCSVIEATLTAATFSDRILGVSETAEVPATAVHVFTGNNIAPAGDLASRSLVCRLNVDRPDPENREFVNDDPVAWTNQHRSKILRALYTLLVFSPAPADEARPYVQPKTRFKTWWSLVGACIEEAAKLLDIHIDFASIFRANETADEAVGALGRLLSNLHAQYGGRRFMSHEIVEGADAYPDHDEEDDGKEVADRFKQVIADLAEASQCDFPPRGPDARRIGKCFQVLKDRPVDTDSGVLTLRCVQGSNRGNTYRIEVRR